MAKRTRGNAGINKLLKRDKKDFIAVGLLIVICLTAFNVIFSDMYIYNGATNSPASFCQSCTSSQFTYGSNWGTWYVNPNAVFPIQLKVNDMYDENSITDVYSKYRVNLVDNSTGGLIKDFSGNFETAGYMESNTIYYNYTVAKESTVVARVYLSRDGGLSWEESYYYQTGTSPSWTFKYQPTTVSDIDKDGIPDDTDLDPTHPETYNGYLDNDGVPDTVPSYYTPSSTGDSGSTSPPPITPVTPTTPATTTNGTTTTTTTTNTNTTGTNDWLSDALSTSYQSHIISPSKSALSQVGFIFESDDGKTKTIYFEGVGPDNYQGELPAIIDPNLWNTNNITPLSSLEDTVTTISYEWDINGDGNAEYSGADKRKISHTYTFATGEGKKVVDVYFRVKLQKGDETFYAKPDQVHFIIYKDSSIWSLSCEEWSSKWSYIGLDVIALPFCWLLKGAWFVGTIPFRVGANIAGTFEYICASSYGMTAGVLFPLLLVLFFLLLLIVPDDIISFGIASVLVYVLGTTAPAVGTLSMLASAGGTLATIGSNASLIAIGGGISLGPKAIFWILFLLAVKETFYAQGALTVPFVSYVKKGEDIIPKESQMTLKYGSGISQLRHVVGEGVFVVLGAMWVEYHWNIPLYTIILGIIDQVIELLQMVGGAI